MNHFIEIQKDEEDNVWIMIHSGSRNLGAKIADHHHKLAVKLNTLWHTKLPIRNGKPVTDLAFLPIGTKEARSYIKDMKFALKFAKENRRRMMECVKLSIMEHFKDKLSEGIEFNNPIDVHHNYASLENHFGRNVWVHRKGATSAKREELGIIPGSQGSCSYIARGLGNRDSFNSCSHGAGRKHGRKEACRVLNAEEETGKMGNVVFDSWDTTTVKIDGEKVEVPNLEEASGAYKDIDSVMKAQEDLVEIVTKLTPMAVIKGKKRQLGKLKSGRN